MMFLYGLLAGVALDQACMRGWLKLAYDWVKTKATERKPTALPMLDMANAAPEASPADKQKFSMTALYIGVALFGALAVAFAITVALKKYPKIEPTASPAVILPAVVPDGKISPSITRKMQAPKDGRFSKPAIEPVPTVASVPPVVLPVAVKSEPVKQIIVERNNAPLPPSPPSPP
jgi:type IV secretory pathway VirB10-like protein